MPDTPNSPRSPLKASPREKLVFGALDNLMQGKTSIVIAHRLSIIQRADVIHVVQDGGIRESGRHDDLMDLGGLQAQLYETQFRRREQGGEEGLGG